MKLNRSTILAVGLPAVIALAIFLPWWRYSFGSVTVSISLWDVIVHPFAPGFLDTVTVSLPSVALAALAVTAAVFGYQQRPQAGIARFGAGILAIYLYLRFMIRSGDSIFAIGALLAAVCGVGLILERMRPDMLDKIPFPDGEMPAPPGGE